MPGGQIRQGWWKALPNYFKVCTKYTSLNAGAWAITWLDEVGSRTRFMLGARSSQSLLVNECWMRSVKM